MEGILSERMAQFDTAQVNHLYQEEVRLLELIKSGDAARLEAEMDKGPLAFPFVTADAKKSYEYMLVSATAVICRTSIEAGSSVSGCILLSDRFLRRISELQTEEESHALLREIVLTYASLNKKSRFAGSRNALVGKAQRDILDHLFSPLSLADVSNHLGVSPAHLARCFQKELHLTVNQYIAQQKIDAAKSLLRTTTRDVREISDALSFSSAAYFGKVFRQQTGMTPTQFRQRQG